MGFNQTTGVYTPASGALTATPGQVVQSAVWDAIFTDMSNSLTAIEQQLQATYGQRNIIGSNGGMEVWQRGAGAAASFALAASAGSPYTADRWYLFNGANQASTVAAVAGIATGSRLAAKVTRNSGQTGVGLMTFSFPLDTDECAMIAGQIVALSFIAKAGANWSPAGGNIQANFAAGTGAAAKTSAGFAGQTNPISTAFALTASAQRFTVVSTVVPLTTTQAEVQFALTPVGTAGADDSFTVDDVQLEILPSATSPIAAFERWPFERMLAACKRHYRKSFPYGTAPVQNGGLPGAAVLVEQAATASGFWIQHAPISLRATGAYTSYNPSAAGAGAVDITQGASLAVSLDAAGVNSPDVGMIYVSASGGTITVAAKDLIAIHWQADAGI